MTDPLHECVTNTNPNSNVDVYTSRLCKPWEISPNGVQFTAQWEAFSARLYDNDGGGGGGNTTIGYGHLVHMGPISGAPSEAQWRPGITQQQAVQLLHEDLKVAERIINQKIKVPLFQHEYDALVDFVYNVRGNSKESLLDLVNTGHYDQLPAKFMEYTAARGAHPSGLVKRRHSEGNLFSNGDYNASH